MITTMITTLRRPDLLTTFAPYIRRIFPSRRDAAHHIPGSGNRRLHPPTAVARPRRQSRICPNSGRVLPASPCSDPAPQFCQILRQSPPPRAPLPPFPPPHPVLSSLKPIPPAP